jgi:hypothetical protein
MVILTGSVYGSVKLVQRLKAFCFALMIAVPCLTAVAITYLVEVRVRDPRGREVDAAWFTSVSEAQQATTGVVLGAMLIVGLLALQLLGVLVALRQFVMTQEIDLISRDQIALHQVTKAGDTQGIPVGTVPAPD